MASTRLEPQRQVQSYRHVEAWMSSVPTAQCVLSCPPLDMLELVTLDMIYLRLQVSHLSHCLLNRCLGIETMDVI